MSQAKPIPDGMHSLTPHLVCAGAAEATPLVGRDAHPRPDARRGPKSDDAGRLIEPLFLGWPAQAGTRNQASMTAPSCQPSPSRQQCCRPPSYFSTMTSRLQP